MATLTEVFTNIANAIRNKTGKTNTMTPAEMVSEINTLVKPTSTKSASIYTPTTLNQTIAAGTYCSGTQTIKGDANLVAENIKSGVSIFGVEGTMEGGGGNNISGSDCLLTIENNSPYGLSIGASVVGPNDSIVVPSGWSSMSSTVSILSGMIIMAEEEPKELVYTLTYPDGTAGEPLLYFARKNNTSLIDLTMVGMGYARSFSIFIGNDNGLNGTVVEITV